MKQNLLSLLLVFISCTVIGQNNSRDVSTIDTGDTVIFNLAQSVVQSGYVEFPVSFRSDDVINALDFSLKYNTAEFELDTIIRLASYLTATYNLTGDTTLYFTSYSLQTITNDTPLVKVRFNILSGQLCSGDLNSVAVYLNGETCAVHITDAPGCPLSISEVERNISSLIIYPNPLQDIAELSYFSKTGEDVSYSISDVAGRVFIYENRKSIAGDNHLSLHMNGFAAGVYVFTLKGENDTKSIRLVKE